MATTNNYYPLRNSGIVKFTERMRLFHSSLRLEPDYGKNVQITGKTFTNVASQTLVGYTGYANFSKVATLSAGGEMKFTGTDPNQIVDVDMDGGAGANKVTFDKGYGNNVTVKGRIWNVEEVNFNGPGTANFTNDGVYSTAASTNNLDGLKNVNVGVADDLAWAENGFTPVFSPVALATGVDFSSTEFDGITFKVEGAKNGTNRDQITFGKGLTGVTFSFAGAGVASNVKMEKDASNTVMNYMASATADTYSYRLGYGKNALTRTKPVNEGYFVNSAYADIEHNDKLDGLTGGTTYGGSLGLTEFSSLRLEGTAFGTYTYGTEHYDQYNSPFDQFPDDAYTSYIFLTGGSYSQNQYGYGSNLKVCDDQRHGQSYVGSAGVVTDPLRSDALPPEGSTVHGMAANTKLSQVTGALNGTTSMEYNVLFGGSNVHVYDGTVGLNAYLVNKDSNGDTIYTVCTAAQLSSHVDIFATINAAGIVSGSNINVKSTGGTVTSTNCNLFVGMGNALYYASSVNTTPSGSWGQLIGGNYICGGNTDTNTPYSVTVNGGSNVFIDDTAGGITVRGFAVGGSKVGSKKRRQGAGRDADRREYIHHRFRYVR